MELPAPLSPASIDHFFQLDLRAGTVLRAESFPKARKPAYKLWIDFGPLGVKQSSAQVTARYRPEDLVGRQVVAVVNFPPRQVADFRSEVLVLGASDLPDADGVPGSIVLLSPDAYVPDGNRIH